MTANSEHEYLDILRRILEKGVRCPNRTGVDALTLPHFMLQHDMADGFPLLTTKKMAWKTMKVELEGFLHGVRSKQWYRDRGCNIWNQWANPTKIPPGLGDDERKKAQILEDDLGPIYGAQWGAFNGDPSANQLQRIVDTLKKNPDDRRMLCSAWNPLQIHEMALPPCHFAWHVMVTDGRLHLCWVQRSVDAPCGLPVNISSYALLLHLLAKESGLKEGTLTGFLMNVHIYVDQVDGVKEQIGRKPFPYPRVETPSFTSVFDWKHGDTQLIGYECHPKIHFPIAV